jgi:two-component system sensor histidine kinase RegB
LPALIEAARDALQPRRHQRQLSSRTDRRGVPTTAPDQVRSPEIMQGIGNIVQNAVSFAHRQIRIATRWTTEWSEVEVSDDGPGFSESLLDELGTPFISTRQGVEGHMGLGVFIAKTLLERTGATVSFGNRGNGTAGGCRCRALAKSRLQGYIAAIEGVAHDPGHRRQSSGFARPRRHYEQQGTHLADRR